MNTSGRGKLLAALLLIALLWACGGSGESSGGGAPATVPTVADFKTLFSLGGKPVAVCETSYPAEPFTVYGGLAAMYGTPALQSLFFANMLAAADQVDMRFIINFVLRDYDALWQEMGSPDDLNNIWRDTGFCDENGNERPVLTVWREKLP